MNALGSSHRSCVSPAELFHFALLSSKRLVGHLLTRYEARWRQSRRGKQWVRERERERVHGGCVLRQGISVRMVPSAHQCSHPFFSSSLRTLNNLQTNPELSVLLRMSHLRMESSWMRFCSPLKFQASARFKAPPCQLTVFFSQFCAGGFWMGRFL